MNFSDYDKFSKGFIQSDLKKFSTLYNRRPRHTNTQEFNLPIPIPHRIDISEFASKQEQNDIFIVLIKQLFGFKNMPDIPTSLKNYLGITGIITKHDCKYCGKCMDISDYDQKYAAKEHYLNLCHDDPHSGTYANNLYYGHTMCNREQGGYSIEYRIQKGFELLTRNTDILSSIPRELVIEVYTLLKSIVVS